MKNKKSRAVESMNWGDIDFLVGDRCRRKTDEPLAVISANMKTLWLNAAFLREVENELKNNTHVLLGFSKKNNAIVIRFVSAAHFGASKLSFLKTSSTSHGRTATFCGQRFFNQHDLKALSGRYTPHKIDAGWAIFLNKKLARKSGVFIETKN